MRLLFLLLLLANVVFFVYAHVAKAPEDAASQIQRLQLHPEKIKLIGKDGAVAVGSAPSPQGDSKTAEACLEWGLFAGPAVARADAAVARLGLPPGNLSRAVVDASAYWVYIPAPKTRPDIDTVVQDLKARRVTDFFVVQDPPQWRNAISLGIFQSAESANGLLNALREKGVHNAVVERRENFLKQIAYYVRQPSVAMVGRLAELQREFPASEVKAVPCPAVN